MSRLTPTVLLLATAAIPVAGQATNAPTDRSTAVPHTAQAVDSAAAVATVDAYHAALETGDTAAVRALLADEAIIQEGGGIETRAEYFSHHLAADMAFAAAVPGERRVVRVRVAGDMAWVASRSHRSGVYRDREIDLQGAELMVLTRTPDGWRIAAIHWSSRSRS